MPAQGVYYMYVHVCMYVFYYYLIELAKKKKIMSLTHLKRFVTYYFSDRKQDRKL